VHSGEGLGGAASAAQGRELYDTNPPEFNTICIYTCVHSMGTMESAPREKQTGGGLLYFSHSALCVSLPLPLPLSLSLSLSLRTLLRGRQDIPGLHNSSSTRKCREHPHAFLRNTFRYLKSFRPWSFKLYLCRRPPPPFPAPPSQYSMFNALDSPGLSSSPHTYGTAVHATPPKKFVNNLSPVTLPPKASSLARQCCTHTRILRRQTRAIPLLKKAKSYCSCVYTAQTSLQTVLSRIRTSLSSSATWFSV
jgi:hypothetical protein